jgi:hypothetical protein
VVLGTYSVLTYPKDTITIPISFTIGVDATTRQFDQPMLCDKVQVQVSVASGNSFWKAQILNGSQIIWEHGAGQGEQTSYKSEWIGLPSGSYEFSFRTLGIGSLNAQVTLKSKGGFW